MSSRHFAWQGGGGGGGRGRGRGVHPYISYIGLCGVMSYGFLDFNNFGLTKTGVECSFVHSGQQLRARRQNFLQTEVISKRQRRGPLGAQFRNLETRKYDLYAISEK